jgi:hypothetical protein
LTSFASSIRNLPTLLAAPPLVFLKARRDYLDIINTRRRSEDDEMWEKNSLFVLEWFRQDAVRTSNPVLPDFFLDVPRH